MKTRCKLSESGVSDTDGFPQTELVFLSEKRKERPLLETNC